MLNLQFFLSVSSNCETRFRISDRIFWSVRDSLKFLESLFCSLSSLFISWTIIYPRTSLKKSANFQLFCSSICSAWIEFNNIT